MENWDTDQKVCSVPNERFSNRKSLDDSNAIYTWSVLRHYFFFRFLVLTLAVYSFLLVAQYKFQTSQTISHSY